MCIYVVFQGIGVRLYQGFVGFEDIDGIDMVYRVVVDYVRILIMVIIDGGKLDNIGRG